MQPRPQGLGSKATKRSPERTKEICPKPVETSFFISSSARRNDSRLLCKKSAQIYLRIWAELSEKCAVARSSLMELPIMFMYWCESVRSIRQQKSQA